MWNEEPINTNTVARTMLIVLCQNVSYMVVASTFSVLEGDLTNGFTRSWKVTLHREHNRDH